MLCSATWVAAQTPVNPPDPPDKPVWQWIFTVIFAGVLGAIAFWNPKRSHQS
ncbi:MAG TPA: hypothetical protein VGM03_13285 [Phycisphaerae bacterium]